MSQHDNPADIRSAKAYIQKVDKTDFLETLNTQREELEMPKLNNAPETEMLAELDTIVGALEMVEADMDFSELDDLVQEEIVEETLEASNEVPETLDDDLLADLDMSVQRAATYAAQTSAAMPDLEETKTVNATAGTQKTKVRVTKTAAAPRAPRDLISVPAEFFKCSPTDDADDAKTKMIAARPTQVKIAEKFDQLFAAISVGKRPSVYVSKAFEVLEAKGIMTTADLVTAYKLSGLGEGTARSQTGQIMELFKITGIATRTGQTLTSVPTSQVAERLRRLPATPAATV